MKFCIFLIALFLTSTSCEQDAPKINGTVEQFTTVSAIVNDDYTIYVYLPPNYDANIQYPLIVGADGDNEIEPLAEIIDELILDESIPPSLFVAIGYGSEEANDQKRNRDYTSTG